MPKVIIFYTQQKGRQRKGKKEKYEKKKDHEKRERKKQNKKITENPNSQVAPTFDKQLLMLQ